MFDLHSAPDTWAPACAVFDCDGVLLDSETLWNDVQHELLGRYGITVTPELEESLVGVAAADLARTITRLSPHATGEEDFYQSVLTDVQETEMKILDRQVVPIPGALDVIVRLAQHIPVAVASNSSGELLQRKMQKFGYADLLTTWVSSSDVPAPKPAPDIYRKAVARLGFSPRQALTVEDSATGLQAATSAGTRCLVFMPQTPAKKELLQGGIGRFDSFTDPGLLTQLEQWLKAK